MQKKLTKHGNSLALVIDKPVLELLKIDQDTLLEIATDGTVLMISPVQKTERKEKFQKVLDKTNTRYAKTLKKLAK